MSRIRPSTQFAQDGAADGQVWKYDAASGSYVPYTPGGGSSGGSPWTQVVNETGASFTHWTGASGTWGSDGTEIQQTNTSGTSRARLNNLVTPGVLVFQADVRIDSGSSSDQRAGLVVGFDGTNGSGILARLHINGSTADAIQVESDSASARWSKSMNWGGQGVWKTLRLVVGGGVATLFLDGVLQGSAGNNAQASNDATYIGLMTGDCAASFRNIEAWTLTLP